MKEEIGQILEQLKLKNLSVAKVEKALEYSNGTLGKARDGKINLPVEKMEKLRAYAKVHLEKPTLDRVLKPLEIDPLSDLIDVRKEQDAFCIERGWNVSDLIEKIKGFEVRIKYYAESKIELEQELGRITEENIVLLAKNAALEADAGSWRLRMAQTTEALTNSPAVTIATTSDKPQISPETGLPVNPSKNSKKAKDGAENTFDAKVVASYFDKEGRKTGESKPIELSPFLKARQNLKNGIKNQ